MVGEPDVVLPHRRRQPGHALTGEETLDGDDLVAAGNGDGDSCDRHRRRDRAGDEEESEEEGERFGQFVADAFDPVEEALAEADLGWCLR